MKQVLNAISIKQVELKKKLNQLKSWQYLILILLISIILQLPLVVNPGYFSHDELQWASRADVISLIKLPWESWLGIEAYQYRPLTFNVWLLASYFLFDYPYLFHALLVIWGSLNVVLLASIAGKYDLSSSTIIAAVMIFVLSPYVLYVHGWVATMADLLVMTSLLLMILCLLNIKRIWKQVLVVLVFSVLAFMSKESALSIPALFLILWFFDGFKKSWLIAMLVSGIVAVVYLALRFPVLLQQPAETHYSLSIWHIPLRWLEYHFYWLIPNAEEPNTIFTRGLRSTVLVVAMILASLMVAIWQSHKKSALMWLAGSFALLFPVLPIASSASQYGYLFAAWTVFIFAGIWKYGKKWHKSLLVFVVFLSIWHGLKTMSMMQKVGQIQSVFSVQLAETVSNYENTGTIKLSIDNESSRWIFKRLSHDIHGYENVEMANNVRIVDKGEQADFTVFADGQINKNPD